MLASVALLPIMDGFAKSMSGTFAIAQLVWARFLFQSLLIVPLALATSPYALLRPARLSLQVARGFGILIGTFLFFGAIRTMPIADALALLFIAPLIVTALSPLVLGEAVGVRRWAAVLVGFAGALVVLRPGLTVLQPGALLALGAGCSFAGYGPADPAAGAPPLRRWSRWRSPRWSASGCPASCCRRSGSRRPCPSWRRWRRWARSGPAATT